jgi:hypothetical protein
MDGQGKPDLGALLRAVARSGDDLNLLRARCWPGEADRSEPAGRAWVRAWRPARALARVPVCRCATGRCSVCN